MRKLNLSPEEWLERRRQQARDTYHRCRKTPEYRRKRKIYNLKHRFGLSEQEYNQMFIDQKGRCAICDRHQSEFNRGLYVDHCHITGKVRKLLCCTCNTFLGAIKDCPEKAAKVQEYLKWQ